MLALEKTDTNDINIFPTENAGDSAVTNLKIKLLKKKKNTEKNSTYTQKAKKTDVPLLSYIRFSN